LLLPHEVGAALAVPCVAELVVRAVLLWRVGFTAARGIAADVVLLRERSRSQAPQGDDPALDGIDAALGRSRRRVGHGAGECSRKGKSVRRELMPTCCNAIGITGGGGGCGRQSRRRRSPIWSSFGRASRSIRSSPRSADSSMTIPTSLCWPRRISPEA